MRTITIERALAWIRGRAGKVFAVRFTKRTTGESRLMDCRQGVKRHLARNPANPGLDFKAHDLIPVYDMALAAKLPEGERSKAYRCIPKEGITHVCIAGHWFRVRHSAKKDVQQATG